MKSRCNPFTGEPLRHFESTNVEHQLNALRQRQASWRSTPLEDRIDYLLDALRYFEENCDAIGHDIAREMGRPVKQATGEVDGLLERARYLAEIAPSVLAPETVGEKPGFDRAIVHEPLGVVFIISAWNYPLLITINGVMASLLAGNTVLLKHASQTLSIGDHFERAFGDVLAHAVTDHGTAGSLLRERRVDHAIFTGSVEAGRKVYLHAAQGLLDCQLELGGKDGAYVAADADLELAAATLVDGAMYNSGQSCCGVERVFVHADFHDAFVERCHKLIDDYVLGDPLDPATTMGPLALGENAQIMESQVADALAKGAKLITGGKRRTLDEATFFEPTLITGVTPSMTIMQEENFGPILPVMAVSNDAAAIERINDSHYGLTAIIFTQDADLAHHFAREAQAGTVFQNRCDYLDPALPWTGVKDSGIGSSLSRYGLLGVTRRKSRHFRIGN